MDALLGSDKILRPYSFFFRLYVLFACIVCIVLYVLYVVRMLYARDSVKWINAGIGVVRVKVRDRVRLIWARFRYIRIMIT